ncbi:MAG: MazG nucleotide pyrophosphohydrolase domain-containing protein [Desulfobulbus sp.]|jgi:uncharacterized protein YabN with tetrapyrrole methylase and pyrophosphatase domain
MTSRPTPPLPDETLSPYDRLQQVVATLRGDTGCPWDRKQTPASLKRYLLEECQELADAVDQEDPAAIREEIGDVLFILTMLTTMFTERRLFTADDVLTDIVAKMIRRHPHVFAQAPTGDEAYLREQWERIKRQEKTDTP